MSEFFKNAKPDKPQQKALAYPMAAILLAMAGYIGTDVVGGQDVNAEDIDDIDRRVVRVETTLENLSADIGEVTNELRDMRGDQRRIIELLEQFVRTRNGGIQ